MTKKAAQKSKNKSSSNRNQKGDIIKMILDDHKPLKKLIKVMKNSDKSLSERRKAFMEFAPLLVTHAKPEEKILYVHMKRNDDLREEGFEGDVEHGLAEQLLEEARGTKDDDLWSARVKVLAELVEHHIEEEEEELLPEFMKNSKPIERVEMGRAFLKAKANTLEDGIEKVPKRANDPNSILRVA